METYYTKVSVQADRYIVETEKPTIIVENEEEFNKRRDAARSALTVPPVAGLAR